MTGRTLLALAAGVVAIVASSSPAATGNTGRAAVPAAGQARIYVLAHAAGTAGKGALFVVDMSGHRSLLTDFGSIPLPGRGKQPDGKHVNSVAVEQDGTILVVDAQAGGQGELFASTTTAAAVESARAARSSPSIPPRDNARS